MSDVTVRKLRCIVFTDMVGFSALAQRDEERALSLLREQREIAEPIFESHGGTVIKSTGDGFLVEFDNALAAARCAVALQERFRSRNDEVEPKRRFHVRVGLHLGDVVLEGGDVYGDGVNIASRVEACAPPGGICLTGAVAHQIENKLDLPLAPLGRRKLKNIDKPVDLYGVVLPWEKSPTRSQRRAPGTERDIVSLARRLPLRWAFAGLATLIAVVAAWAWLGDRGTSAVAPEIRSLAVLPLENMTGDPGQEYFADGMTDALINDLARIGALRVISRTSAMRFKETDLSVPEIAEELDVDAVLEGSVQRSGDRVRISAQLIEAPTDHPVWAETYTRDLGDVLALQSEIARAVAEEVEVALTPEESRRLTESRPVDPTAHEAYLRGRFVLLSRQSPESISDAIEHFERALEIDPGYALARAGLADAHLVFAHFGMRPREALSEAKRHALLALELDPDLAEAHTALADARFHLDWEWEAAESGFRRAIEISPNYSTAHWWYSGLLAALGRHEEAIAEIRRAQELDPLFAGMEAFAVRVYWWAKRPGLARAGVERLRRMVSPDAPGGLNVYTFHAVELPEDLVARMEAARRAGEGHPAFLVTLALQHARDGREEAARSTLEGLAPMADRMPYQIARIHAALGDSDGTLEWLERAAELRDAALPWVNVEPLFDPFRGEPRFRELLRRMRLA